jgi:RNA recognition motif-containing protein
LYFRPILPRFYLHIIYVHDNTILVGGISAETTESELCRVFSAYGNVKSTKIIVDRAGVSKGYGFVTFETELEASRLHDVSINITKKIYV